MRINNIIMSNEEKTIFTLRALYEKYGYSHYRMSKFEEYDLYVRNKNFLVSDNIITFTDTNGKLMALKPDVTLSIVKNYSEGQGIQKVYYNENVYRVSKNTDAFTEIMQMGVECMGNIGEREISEVLTLAVKSLEEITPDFVLDVSNMGVLAEVLDTLSVPVEKKPELLSYIGEKNTHDINGFDECEKLKKLVLSSGGADEMLGILTEIYKGDLSKSAYILINTVKMLEEAGYKDRVRIDFSVLNDMNYYNGIVFKGFVNKVAQSVLSGGEYASLMKKMGKKSGAIGFAVYLDILDRFDAQVPKEERTALNIALPKGRLGETVYAMFEKAGFECPSIKEQSRKLIFENKELSLRYFWVKPSDVAIYVERGAADIGVCGKDILLEYSPDVYELADLALGKCRMAVAAKNGYVEDPNRTLRVATKFSNIAKGYYASKGRDIDIIHLNGSIELAPVLDLSDVIVDIVETGTTLKENNLSVFEEIVQISARLIANRSSYKFKTALIESITNGMRKERDGK